MNKHFQMQHCHNISTISQSANNRLAFLRFDGIRLQFDSVNGLPVVRINKYIKIEQQKLIMSKLSLY